MKLLTSSTPAHAVHIMRFLGAPILTQPSGIDHRGACVAKGGARCAGLVRRLNAEG